MCCQSEGLDYLDLETMESIPITEYLASVDMESINNILFI